MSETAKVRLVRCPKCENLLPEVTDYSVYQCGGCGAVLKAKNKGVDLDTFSEKSDEERTVGDLDMLSDRYEKMMNVSDRRMMSDGSESDVRSTISSSSRAERRRVLRDRDEISGSGLNREANWEVEVDMMRDRRSDDIQRGKMSQDFEDWVMHHDSESGLRRPGRVGDIRIGEKGVNEGVRRSQRRREEGSMDHMSVSSYDFEDPARNSSDVDRVNNVDYVGDDRAELLRQLEELRDKLNRSGNLNDKGKETVPHVRRMSPQDPYVSENHMMMQNSYHDAQFKRQPLHNQYDEPPPLMRRQEMVDNGVYPPRYARTHVQGYGNPSRSHNHRRGPFDAQASYEMPTARPYVSGPYPDEQIAYMETMEQYHRNGGLHHASCTCYQCRVRIQASTPIMPAGYVGKFPNFSDDMISNYGDNHNPGPYGSRDYNRRIPDPPPLRTHTGQGHARWPSDVKSEADGFIRRQPLRPHLAAGVEHCCPIAGGAPFLTCNNCSELLLLPRKILNQNGNRKKLRCRACSSVIAVVVSGKSLVVSLDVEAKDSPPKVGSKCDVPSTHADSHPSQTRTTFPSEDYDNSGYNFHSVDREVAPPAARQGKDNKATETRTRHSASASAYASEGEEEGNASKDTGSADLPREDKVPAPPAGSSLQDYFEYSNKYKVVKDSGAGNRSGHSEHDSDRVFPSKSVVKQFLRKESSATEIDISSHEFSNTGSTFESSELTRDSRGGGSFLAGIMGTFKEPHKSEESVNQENASVTVNGHLISDRLLKKAEKLAGPIQPGHYWYDFRAGFWGAIGVPCLGIIPPFIEEFNYPMPEHCAGGNTSIFVNGRELNHKDLNLLGSRGLPRERDRYYIIEISGRVLDEETGEELESLGKLAPTMEKAKRGFGMRVPQAVA